MPDGLGCGGNQPQQCDSLGIWQDIGSPCAQPTPGCLIGACGCPTQTCDGVCVDASSDVANCGGCGKVCSPWETCGAAICTCDPGFVADGGQGVFVSVASGSDVSGDGSMAKPWSTITKGIAGAATQGWPNVYVAPGTYNENLVVPDTTSGLSIQGGWAVGTSSWTRDCNAGTNMSSTVLQGTSTAVKASNVVHPSGLWFMTIKTQAAAVAANDTDGASVIAVLVSGDNSAFYLHSVNVTASNADNGGASSAVAGATGCKNYACSNGATGAVGASGTAAGAAGTFTALGFTPADGMTGSSGSGGNAGTTGGSGSCAAYNTCGGGGCGISCQSGGANACGTNGTCGCGGSGGASGKPGHGGGTSAALLVSGTNANVTLTGSTLQSGKGGQGSAGGTGGSGAAGSSGSAGNTVCGTNYSCVQGASCGTYPYTYHTYSCQLGLPACGGGGAAGGKGGTGGAGGTGGGGAGGPSYAVVTLGGAAVNADAASVLKFGAGGAGGGTATAGGAGQIHNGP